ncbi:unnamed protein product [Oncorhynchus mykiss]|uniref:Uncharacterized protein n=1 Tax=Oncorhynchus mykiss TaxID=8022 RepID=A0A060ZFM1_ONCMY|nr:unnamed protein product [Oncorhynchus mykiss]
MDRNPSPPPDREGEQGGEEVDAIGETVYSKHWLFSTFTRLIQIVSEQNMGDSDAQMQLPEEDEDELCKIWDMAMDKVCVSLFNSKGLYWHGKHVLH